MLDSDAPDQPLLRWPPSPHRQFGGFGHDEGLDSAISNRLPHGRRVLLLMRRLFHDREPSPTLLAVVRLVVHVVVGTVAFAVIAIAGFAVSLLMNVLEQYGIGGAELRVLHALQTFVLVGDAILFGIFLVREGVRFLKEIL
jgi:hypothetical protein